MANNSGMDALHYASTAVGLPYASNSSWFFPRSRNRAAVRIQAVVLGARYAFGEGTKQPPVNGSNFHRPVSCEGWHYYYITLSNAKPPGNKKRQLLLEFES